MSFAVSIVLVLVAITNCQTIDDISVMPLKFQLHYIFDDGDTPLQSYMGIATIWLKVMKNVKYLEIVYSGSVNAVQIKNLNESMRSLDFVYSTDNDRHRFDSELFKTDNVYELLLNFTQMEYGRGLELEFTHCGSPIVYTSDSEYGFPSFGTSHFDSMFELQITHNSNFTAISNTPATRIVDNETNRTITQFENTSNFSLDLFGFVIGRFVSRPIENRRNYPLHMYGPESKITNFFGHIFSAYENYLDWKLPELKIDIVAIPNLSINSLKLGLILVGEKMFYDRIDPRDALIGINKVSKAIGDHFILNSIEIEYKWFSNGLTSYLADKMLDNLEPKIQNIIAFNDIHSVMIQEYTISDFNVHKDGQYHKKAAIFRMIEHAIGAAQFQANIQRALKLKQNLAQLLAESFNEQINFTEFMSAWISHTGYPIVKIDRDYDTGAVVLSQKPIGPDSDATWFVPYNLASKSNPSYNETIPDGWLTDFNTTVMSDLNSSDWIICNKQATGYYLVNYDEINTNRIIDELKNGRVEKIHPLNRANLLTSGYIMTLSGEMVEETFLRILSYLERENDPRPWFVADQILDKLHKDAYGREKSYLDQLNSIILSISRNLYDNYTIGLNPFTRYIAMKWSCVVGYSKCIQDFDQLSITYLESVENGTTITMPSDMRSLMMCYGFRNESNYIKLYSYDSNEFRQMIENRIDCHLDTNVFRWEFMKSFIFKMFNYRTYFDQLNWMEYLEYVPGFNLRIGDLVFQVFERNLSEFDAIYVDVRNTELKLLPFKYINELLVRYTKQVEHLGYEFNRTRFDQMVATIKKNYGEAAAGLIIV